MKCLHIDIETFSPEPIADTGNYKYAMHPDFQILLCAWAYDDDPVQCFDLAQGEPLPEWFLLELTNPDIIKCAHNATFERVCFTMLLREYGMLRDDQWLDARQWQCSMVQCARCGLPLSLDQAGAALGIEQQKMKEGKALIQLFCVPHESKEKNGLFGAKSRVMPSDQPDKWEVFKSYCIRDVEAEREIAKNIDWYPVSDFEKELYAVDQQINDRGVLIDRRIVQNAISIDSTYKARLNIEAVKLSGLDNPNSVSQLKRWITEQTGIELNTLNKDDIPELTKQITDRRVLRILEIRNEMRKTSCQKYTAMQTVAGPDWRARGVTQFHGSRTGRWAGRLVQMQNLPQNHIKDLDFARKALEDGDVELIEMGYGNVPDVLSQLIRTAFVAPEGKTLAVCDFSAIEARVIAWLAGEKWVLDVFRNGGDIYCATASNMFKVPVEKHGRNAELRQKGKIAVLALGYGGGADALDKMGGQRMGLTRDEEVDIVAKWREANPHIKDLWSLVESAAKQSIVYKTTNRVLDKLTFRYEHGALTIELPSGRKIVYQQACISFDNDYAYLGQSEAQAAADSSYIRKEKKANHLEKYAFTREARIRFKGLDQTTHKWCWIETWGGKLTENIIQAIARDCLAEAMAEITNGLHLPIIFHVHDEIICEVDSPERLADIQTVFARTPEWAEGLPLSGAGYTTPYYMKD